MHGLELRRVVLFFAPVCNIRVILSLTFVPRLSAPACLLPAAGPYARVPSRSFVQLRTNRSHLQVNLIGGLKLREDTLRPHLSSLWACRSASKLLPRIDSNQLL